MQGEISSTLPDNMSPFLLYADLPRNSENSIFATIKPFVSITIGTFRTQKMPYIQR